MKKKKKLPTDPTTLPSEFLKAYGQMLRRWRQEYYQWNAGRYIRCADDTIRSKVTTFLQTQRWPVTRGLVSDVLGNLNAFVHIDERQELNSFLDGEDRGHFLSLENGLLDIGKRELCQHTPDYFTLVRLPYGYDPRAKCPRFEKFLYDVMRGRAEYNGHGCCSPKTQRKRDTLFRS